MESGILGQQLSKGTVAADARGIGVHGTAPTLPARITTVPRHIRRISTACISLSSASAKLLGSGFGDMSELSPKFPQGQIAMWVDEALAKSGL